MDQAISTAAAAVPEDTRIARQFGPIEFIRRLREDELSILVPEVFSRNLLHQRLLFLDSFFINQPDYIEHVLLANHRNYRKSHFQRNILGPLLGEGLLLSEGAFWQRQRRFAAPAFHHRRIADFVAAMTSCTATALERWRGRTEAFDVTREMMALTLDIIARTMFSADISGEVAAVRRLMDVVIARKPSLLDLLGLPAWVPRGEAQVHRRAVAEFDALVARLLAERRRDATDRGDLLAMLLAACDPETGEGMTDKQLRDEILTIFLAGHETTANALSWTWYLLARHPEAEVRLHAEIDQVLGGRVPSFADLAELTWTRMVFEEAMRLYPPAYAITRAAIGEDRIGGVRIPPGATISIWPYVTHPIQALAGARAFRSRALFSRSGRATPSLRLPAIWRRTARLHRQQLRHRRGAGDHRRYRAALPAAPRARPPGPADRVGDVARQGRHLGDAGAAAASIRRRRLAGRVRAFAVARATAVARQRRRCASRGRQKQRGARTLLRAPLTPLEEPLPAP